MSKSADRPYDVALSFAGEDRDLARKLADLLKERGVTAFYDEDETASLWGKNLYEHLADVYSEKARYCVMFVSQHYVRKRWTNHERENAQARAFRERQEYILPLKLDDTSIPGLPDTVGHVDVRHVSIGRVADLICEKLGRDGADTRSAASRSIPMPQRAPAATDRDRHRFIRDAFTCVRDYFRDAIKELEAHVPGVEGDFEEVDSRTFVAQAYLGGRLRARAKVWIGVLGGPENAICYYAGSTDFGRANAMNEWLSVEADVGSIHLRPGMTTFDNANTRMTAEEGAEYLWKQFISQLEH